MDTKIYTPVIIEDTPFPMDTTKLIDVQPYKSGEIVRPKTIPETIMPKKIYAHETIGSSINTKSRKILGEFEFVSMGAIQIGTYQPGVTGDIRVSPNGIVARNKSGINTIVVDPDTGDVTIMGTIQAGSLIAGDEAVRIEEVGGNGRIVLYNNGIPEILIGEA